MSTKEMNETATNEKRAEPASEPISTKLDKKTMLILVGTIAGFVLLIVLNMK